MVPRRQCRPEYDAGYVYDILRVLDRLGSSVEWTGGISAAFVRTERKDHWIFKILNDLGLPGGGCAGNCFNSFPPRLAELPVVWKYFRW